LEAKDFSENALKTNVVCPLLFYEKSFSRGIIGDRPSLSKKRGFMMIQPAAFWMLKNHITH